MAPDDLSGSYSTSMAFRRFIPQCRGRRHVLGSAGTGGTFALQDVDVTPYGFTSGINMTERGCALFGHFGGVPSDIRNPAN